MKRTLLFFLLISFLETNNLFAQSVYTCNGTNVNIRISNCTSATSIGTVNSPQSFFSNGVTASSCGYTWYQIDIPSAHFQSGYSTTAYVATNFFTISGTSTNYLTVQNSPNGLKIHNTVSGALTWIHNSGYSYQYASFENNQKLARTPSSPVISGSDTWYEIYLTPDCYDASSSTTQVLIGWVSNGMSSGGPYVIPYGGSAPVADFTASNTTPAVNQTVIFSDLSSNSPTGWVWSFSPSFPNFVNGTNQNSQNCQVQFTSPGYYTVTLQAQNGSGYNNAVKTNYIYVANAGSPPIANFTSNITSGNAPLTVNFSDLSSNTPNSWSWNFGDGYTSTLQNPSHTYSNSGTYNVTLTSSNSYGSSGPFSQTNYIIVNTGCSTPTITTDPVSCYITTPGSANFGVVATGGIAPYSYLWQYNIGSGWNYVPNSVPYSGVNLSTLNISATASGMNGYQYRCIVSSGNPCNSYSVISNVATLNLSAVSYISITNVIQNNSTFPQPVILWSGNTNQTPTTVKICADASTATRISFVNNTGINSNNIKFWIASDPYGNNSDVSGYFINYSISGNIIYAEYNHPKYLQSTYTPFRADNIRIVDYTNPTQTIFILPIEIYRAPVIMVHGLWGLRSSFDMMEYDLFDANLFPPHSNYSNVSLSPLLFKVGYETTNSKSFTVNSCEIPKAINNILYTTRSDGYSAGKVDIIAHSMGGILARYYLQSTSYQQKQDIHKIITLNTPHSGSQAANLLLNHSTCAGFFAGPITDAYLQGSGNFGKSVNDGAVTDLAVNSIEMSYLNIVYLNNGIIPCHSIVTKDQFSTLTNGLAAALINGVTPCFWGSPNYFLNYLFYNQPNDFIVTVPSQGGGLSPSAITECNNQQHMGSSENFNVISEVINAININSSNSNYFSQNGYSPSINDSSNFKIPIETNSQLLSGSINITYPLSGQAFNPGDIIPVSITSSNGINKIIFEGVSSEKNVYIKDTILSNGIINYHIPNNAFERAEIIVLGYDTTFGSIDYDTVLININIATALDSIKYYPDTIYVQKNNTESFSLTGYFHNGNSYNLEFTNSVQYQVIDTSIASHLSYNVIQGKKIGRTFLSATFMSKNVIIPVVVIPKDTSNISIVTSINNQNTTNQLHASTLNDLIIYPNPSHSTTYLEYELGEDSYTSVKIYNAFGMEVMKFTNFRQDKGIHRLSFDGSLLSNGIYFCKLYISPTNHKEITNFFKTKKFVISK